MAKLWLGWILSLALVLGAALASRAATLSFAPASQSVALGSSAAVDLVLSGLGDSGAPSLGAFDLDVSFDPAVLSLSSLSFGTGLGDGALGDTDEGMVLGSGSLNLFSLSFLTPEELDALQSSDSLVLATLTFGALAPGVSSLGFGNVVLGDAFGAALPLDASSAGSLQVVPEPATLLLLGLSLGALARRR